MTPRRQRSRRWWSLVVVVGGATVTASFAACGNPLPDAGSSGGNPGIASCATPNDGCPCDDPGRVIACGSVERVSGNYVTCSEGNRTCLANKVWGPCSGDTEVRKQLAGGLHIDNLADAASPCTGDPCDPYCSSYVDDPVGLVLPEGGLEVLDGGLTLSPTGTISLGSCTGLVITPATSTLTITSLSPVSPSTLDFTASLVPAGCFPSPITPVWTIDDARVDSVTIQGTGANGHLTVVTPIAGPVTVSAYISTFSATATAQINVDVLDTTAAPAGYAGAFTSTTGAADTLSVLYPYASTVFPLGLPPPIPQWSASPAASAVKVSIRYVNGATSFQWAAIAPEAQSITTVAPSVSITAGQRFPNIPTTAWFDFERSALGNDAQIVVQRDVGGTLEGEVPTTIHFAHGQLKGNVYYQAYGTQLARNFSGGALDSTGGNVFPGGAFGAATMGIAPGATTPTVIAGGTGGNPPDGTGTYCRVCHTASADGSLLVTQKFGGSNYASQRYSNLTGTPTGVDISPADGRFSWPAIFPTGGTASGFLFANAGPQQSYSTGPPPGGLDGSNSTLTSAFYSLATASLGNAVAATYKTGGASPITFNVPSSAWGLQAGVPAFSASGTMVAMQHHAGKVCATGTAAQCTTDELASGDKRSLAVMTFDPGAKQLSGFKILNSEPNTPCNTTFHPSQPCFDVWPSFLPGDTGVVFEKEIFHNGNVGAASSPLSDFGGTRSGCDTNAVCNNDGSKGELWWVNLAGAATPKRLNAAIGRRADDSSYLPVGANAPSTCTVGGFSCTAGGQCCSGTCSNSRCTTVTSAAGAACSTGSQCESLTCVSSKCGCSRDADCATAPCNVATHTCPGNVYYTPPAQSYTAGHGATVEPVLDYEPTVDPTPTYDATGTTPEYDWIVFTSRRQFGNIATVDPWWSDPRRQDISKTVSPKKLWVAAVRANPTSGTDPSFPAFYLPGQEWVSGNSKAYWVQDACKPGDITHPASSACETTQDCCSGATCQLLTPITSPPERYCVPAGACVALGGSCATSSDCCAGRLCSNGMCADPPPIPLYGASAVFDRDYTSACQAGESAVWRFFDYQAVLPTGTSIDFTARTADTAAALPTATPIGTIGTASPPSTTGWTSFPTTVDDDLVAAGTRSKAFLRVEMKLNPSADGLAGPTLLDWRVHFDCVPSE